MKSEKTIDQKFKDLRFILKNRDKQSIKMDAHGGHSVLFIYPPQEETNYIKRIKEEYPKGEFINVAELLVDYVDQFGFDDFTAAYSEYESDPKKLFNEFIKTLIFRIENAGKENKLPILIRTGALSGTGIDNISIMDSQIVHRLPIPLVILYPATEAGDKRLRFLNFKQASDYRSVVIY